MVAFPLIPLAMTLVSEFAPGIVRHFAGDNAADVAEKVVDVAKAVTGEADPQKAVEAVKADPEAVLRFQNRMASLDAELEKAYLADRQNARDRDVKMRQAGYHNYRADIMLTLAFGCLCAIVWAIYQSRLDLPGEILAIFNMAIGAILKMIGDAFQFEFGSSRGSKEKDLRR
jgi:hypothetical protein